MKTIAKIRENDESTGRIIRLGLIRVNKTGYRVVASNGDAVGYDKPQTADKCKADISASWGRWDTYIVINKG